MKRCHHCFYRYLHVDGNGATPTHFYGKEGSTPPSGTHLTSYTLNRYSAPVPSQLEYDSTLTQSRKMSMLETISRTLNNIQTKLSNIENKYTQQE